MRGFQTKPTLVFVLIEALSLVPANTIAHLFLLTLSLVLTNRSLFTATVSTIVALVCMAAFLTAVLAVIWASIGYGGRYGSHHYDGGQCCC